MFDLIETLEPDEQWIWDPQAIDADLAVNNNLRDPKVCFFPKMSTGTIGIRVSKELNSIRGGNLYYCEFKTSKRLYGSSVMFGLSTSDAQLKSNQFIDLLGESDHSCGLSHRGYFYQNCKVTKFMKPLAENKRAIIGILFDSMFGTVSYFYNGKYLGVAVSSINTSISQSLFFTVTSTASGVQVSIVKCLKGIFSLKHFCYRTILKQIRSKDQIDQLFLPNLLNKKLIELLKILRK